MKNLVSRRPANHESACASVSVPSRVVAGSYRLGVNHQAQSMQVNLAEIIRKQNVCPTLER